MTHPLDAPGPTSEYVDFSTGTLARGQSFALKMIVKLSASAANTGAFPVAAKSTAGTPTDTVKGIVNAN